MKNHFRATGYYEPEDISFIIDSNGKFDEVWKLSALLLRKGCKLIDIVEVDNKAMHHLKFHIKLFRLVNKPTILYYLATFLLEKIPRD